MFKNIPEFFPTPKSIIDKMLLGIDFKMINSVLEPSAGKGDIVNEVIEKFKSTNYYNRNISCDIDTIEIENNLQHILRGKEYRVVHNDFLTYNSFKKYDLIIMNPPFSTGDKHLLKALDMQENGGQIVCILNSETIKNPYTNTRKDLINRLEDYNAEIEYIPNAFIDAEHKTPVEIALIKINIPKFEDDSIILDNLRQEEQYKEQASYKSDGSIVDSDFIKGIIERYNFEVKAGLKLIAEYKALKPLMLDSFQSDYKKPILELKLHYEDEDRNSTLENSYIKQIRIKYWQALFTSDQFMGLFTSNLRERCYNRVKELRNYDFSLFNIYTIKQQLHKEMIQGVEDTILKLFEDFSHKYHWSDETSKNIHYYNGWKTNKSWKINKKVIIPYVNAFDTWNGRFKPTDYRIVEKLSDIEKVFNYLDQGLTKEIELRSVLQFSETNNITKKVQTKYFLLTFYKKGTCHIEFTDEELLHKFNLFGSQRKGWLPPSYGKVKYKDMTFEEKQVINDFEGEVSYNKVMNNKDYYIVETSKLLKLA